MVPNSRGCSAVHRSGEVKIADKVIYVKSCLFDTGALSASYVGRELVNDLGDSSYETRRVRHRATLGDAKTVIEITEAVKLPVKFYGPNGEPTDGQQFVNIEFMIIETMGRNMIIGLPDILGPCFEFFCSVLQHAHEQKQKSHELSRTLRTIEELIEEELSRTFPSEQILVHLSKRVDDMLHSYAAFKNKFSTSHRTEVLHVYNVNTDQELLRHEDIGCTFVDKKIEYNMEYLRERASTLHTVTAAEDESLRYPWSQPLDEEAPEETDTPYPVSFSEDILYFMEVLPEEAKKIYMNDLHEHIAPEMLKECPEIIDILTSPEAFQVFVPTEWNGLNIPLISLRTKPGLPDSLPMQPRRIRPQLMEHAQKEFNRMLKYFYVESQSPRACPLVIAPKATTPFIRICGDYTPINNYIEIPQHPIPRVQDEIQKAAMWRVFIDLDMTNSFHQIPLDQASSELLTVTTQWGLYRPRFMPEGVGPASGILQHIVRTIFADYDWIIVIFDNFLVCAADFKDAAAKLKLVLKKCVEYKLVLKLKKSWIGFQKVSFFGYEVTGGQYSLSQGRKDSISAWLFPSNKKQMQSFLGAALFFKTHMPNYSDWSAPLYEMTTADFVWDPGKWTYDYKAHFEEFKNAIQNATAMYFPDYNLPWIVRADASQIACGGVLFQVFTNTDNTTQHQPIAFCSKKFSDPALRWDTYKKEAFALYFVIVSFGYFLKGKSFTLETDHRNLLWIEKATADIVVRWRVLMQSYVFMLRHIPGKHNTVADWISRMYSFLPPEYIEQLISDTHSWVGLFLLSPVIFEFPDPQVLTSVLSTPLKNEEEERGPRMVTDPDHILKQVHGGRNFHHGVAITWARLNKTFPGHRIPIRYVADYIKACPTCQKNRRVMVEGVKPLNLSLRHPNHRQRIGVDHVTTTPADENGNTVVILVVEHFSKFPQAYPAKDYTAETAAIALFKHFCTFGVFHELASDAGSAFTSEVVKQLNQWLGVEHRVALTGRHESNGVERTSAELLKHLKMLVHDERLVHKWSSDTVLPLINFQLADFPNSETGGIKPFELKYGSADLPYFKMPQPLVNSEKYPTLLRELNENLATVRDITRKFQEEVANKRAGDVTKETQNIYQPGDYILWDPKEYTQQKLATKLTMSYSGPYEVIEQVKNDIKCKHLVTGVYKTFHVSRVKPFFGDELTARDAALRDHDQHEVDSIHAHKGNPLKRSSMSFLVRFADGDMQWLEWSPDLDATVQYGDYIHKHNSLFALRAPTAAQGLVQVQAKKKEKIIAVQPGFVALVDIRSYDSETSIISFYDQLQLPYAYEKQYVLKYIYTSWANVEHTRINAECPILQETYKGKYALNNYFIYTYGSIAEHNFDPDTMVLVDEQFLLQYPQLIAEPNRERLIKLFKQRSK